MIITALGKAELCQDAADVLGDCALGDPQAARNTGIRTPFGHQRKHLTFTRRQFLERIVDPPCRDELLNKRGVDCRPASDERAPGRHRMR